jgi:hypothetical protein
MWRSGAACPTGTDPTTRRSGAARPGGPTGPGGGAGRRGGTLGCRGPLRLGRTLPGRRLGPALGAAFGPRLRPLRAAAVGPRVLPLLLAIACCLLALALALAG